MTSPPPIEINEGIESDGFLDTLVNANIRYERSYFINNTSASSGAIRMKDSILTIIGGNTDELPFTICSSRECSSCT